MFRTTRVKCLSLVLSLAVGLAVFCNGYASSSSGAPQKLKEINLTCNDNGFHDCSLAVWA